jgi:hypothetical protein
MPRSIRASGYSGHISALFVLVLMCIASPIMAAPANALAPPRDGTRSSDNFNGAQSVYPSVGFFALCGDSSGGDQIARLPTWEGRSTIPSMGTVVPGLLAFDFELNAWPDSPLFKTSGQLVYSCTANVKSWIRSYMLSTE